MEDKGVKVENSLEFAAASAAPASPSTSTSTKKARMARLGNNHLGRGLHFLAARRSFVK
jgi:hypothetical protein